MNAENPIVKLCVRGMEYEVKGDYEVASALFTSAWEQSANDFERCMAAHYVARHQQSAEETLSWNQRSLDHALAAGDERVIGFFPSLYLNMGKACEDLGKRDEARRFYAMAAQALNADPDKNHGELIRDALERARERVGNMAPNRQKTTLAR